MRSDYVDEVRRMTAKIASLGIVIFRSYDKRDLPADNYINHYTSHIWETNIKKGIKDYAPTIEMSFYDKGDRVEYALHGRMQELRYFGESEEKLFEKIKEMMGEEL